jgi:hypothetical protein
VTQPEKRKNDEPLTLDEMIESSMKSRSSRPNHASSSWGKTGAARGAGHCAVDDLLKLPTPAAGRFEGVGAMAGELVLRVASGHRSVAPVTKDETMFGESDAEDVNREKGETSLESATPKVEALIKKKDTPRDTRPL